MRQTTMQEVNEFFRHTLIEVNSLEKVTTLLARKLWILSLTGSESWLTNALVCKGFSYSIPLEEELALASPPC